MSYLKANVLGTNENVVIEPVKNPTFLILKWVWGILGFWLLLIPTINAISATIKYHTTEYLITDKRVMEKYGFISTHTDEMPITKIENIIVTYTFWGRIFNYAEIQFQGSNRNPVIFSCIKNAEMLKREFHNAFN